jgi:hypothetical protein
MGTPKDVGSKLDALFLQGQWACYDRAQCLF